MIYIHHGPGVENKLSDLLEGKILVKPAYEDLKTDAVKDLVAQFSQVWPQDNACLMAGPLDEASPDVLDTLLKRIEEPFERAPELILWARDYGGVPLTIRSRCGERYHYAPELRSDLYKYGEALFLAVKAKDALGVVSALKAVNSGDIALLVKAYIEVLLEERELEFYSKELRELFKGKMTLSKVCSFFMEEIQWR